jgi:hypothetical protein
MMNPEIIGSEMTGKRIRSSTGRSGENAQFSERSFENGRFCIPVRYNLPIVARIAKGEHRVKFFLKFLSRNGEEGM